MTTPSHLLIPSLDKPTLSDSRLAAIARFSGVDCETIPIADVLRRSEAGAEQRTCLVINAALFKELGSTSRYPPNILELLAKRFRFLLVHGLKAEPFSDRLVNELSDGALLGIDCAPPGDRWSVAADLGACSEPLAGRRFGVATSTDSVFRANATTARAIASIGRIPALAHHSGSQSDVVFLASDDFADLDAPIKRLSLEPHFSGLIVPMLALRFLFGDRCWRPSDCRATLIIDDPALWRRFGFIEFDRVMDLLDRHSFHMAIGFIPYNYRRSTKVVSEMFRSRPDRLSICYHGNDHTKGEFQSEDVGYLNSALKTAGARMETHKARTGIRHDNVMVFPQGAFSSHAMRALRANNFVAAVNSGGYPQDQGNSLTLGDVAAPAVMKFCGFPLFFRHYLRDFSPGEIALQRFLGKPLLTAEHHQVFKNPDVVTSFVSMVRSIVPAARWTSTQAAVENASLYRRAEDGSIHVRIYANQGVLHNDSSRPETYVMERAELSGEDIDHVEVDGQRCPYELSADGFIRCTCRLVPGESRTFRVVYSNTLSTSPRLSEVRWKVKVFARRRLSDFRDMYVRNENLLAAAKAVHRLVLGRL